MIKLQAGPILESIMMWNEERKNLTYSCIREGSMIEEELAELGTAYREEDLVGEADALADIIFVAVGSLYKLCQGDKNKFERIMEAVIYANNSKSSSKNEQGKITKPEDFVGPEEVIKEVLNDQL